MKSFKQHLATRDAAYAPVANTRKPVLRSSAIFPVLHEQGRSSRVNYMGYWLLKREIPELAMLLTLRDATGQVLLRDLQQITSATAKRIELPTLLAQVFGKVPTSFQGSLELEVNSTRDLVFPYPAFVLEYYGPGFNAAVHTTGRIYNDVEDMQENSESTVAESGFDVWPGGGRHPFFAFTNGPLANDAPLVNWVLTNAQGKTQQGSFALPPLAPFETRFVLLDDHLDLSLLGDAPGSIKLQHNFSGFFPRFVAGTLQDTPNSISITHTYYDCAPMNRSEDYWQPQDPKHHDAVLFYPLFLQGGTQTETVLYPIFSPAQIELGLFFYDAQGKELLALPDYMELDTTKEPLVKLDYGAILAEQGGQQPEGVLLTAKRKDGGQLPSRLKTGYNVRQAHDGDLGCNICCNLQVYNPKAASKPGTFKWIPLLNHGRSVAVLANFTNEIGYSREANIQVSLYAEGNDEPLNWPLKLAPMGQVRIDSEQDAEVAAHLGGKSGWLVFRSDNPFVTGYYFDFHPHAVAGDHGF